MRSDIKYPDLSYSIIGAAMEVHRALGPGWDEWDYHRSMISALKMRGHRVDSHLHEDVIYNGEVAHHFELDLLVDDLIILELKHIKSEFHSSNYEQILNYLKRWDKRLGILVNFGLQSLAYKRVPYDAPPCDLRESDVWKKFRRVEPVLFPAIGRGLKDVLRSVGYGYGVHTFKRILEIAFRSEGLEVESLIIEPVYKQLLLGSRAVDCIKVDSKLLVSVTAQGNQSSASDLACLKSYMKSASIKNGLLIDIGRPDIQLKGVI